MSDLRRVLTRLNRQIPDELLQQKVTADGKFLDFIGWTTAADLGDDISPEWQNDIKEVKIVGDYLVVVQAVRIKNPDTGEWLSRENVGISPIKDVPIGDAASNAFDMSYKRAWVLWGLGRHLYKAPDYKPHRLAVKEQTDLIEVMIKDNKIPPEFHEHIKLLIEEGHLEYLKAEALIATYSKQGANGRKNGNGKNGNGNHAAQKNVPQAAPITENPTDSVQPSKTAKPKTGKKNNKPAKSDPEPAPVEDFPADLF
jgi:hypothetical protein